MEAVQVTYKLQQGGHHAALQQLHCLTISRHLVSQISALRSRQPDENNRVNHVQEYTLSTDLRRERHEDQSCLLGFRTL
jgi:hypothetical protein